MTATPTRQTKTAIILFVALSIVHLTAIVAGWEPLRFWTKPFLMPLLAATVVLAGGRRFGLPAVLLVIALVFSTLGDIALLGDGSGMFIAGLSAFLLAHLAYIAIFVGSGGTRRPRWWSVAFVGWFAVLMIILVPHLGALLVPVVGYGVVIAVMAITATRWSPLVIVGATLFLLSDSVLAVNRFVPEVVLWEPGLVIMLTYIAGQALIAWGLVATWQSRTSPAAPRTIGATV